MSVRWPPMTAWETAHRAGRRVFYEAATETIRQCPENYCLLARRAGQWVRFLDAASIVKANPLNALLESIPMVDNLKGEVLAQAIESRFF